MSEIILTREDLLTRFSDIDINNVGTNHFRCSMQDVAMAEFVEFRCDKTSKRKCLKA